MPGRGITRLAAGLLACTLATAAPAQFPAAPVHLHIGSAPAGSTDALGRVLANTLEPLLGQPVVVHNTPGAGGAVMASQLRAAPPDGYMLGLTISHAYSGNPVVMPATTPYRSDQFTHLAAISKGQCALVSSTDKPYDNLNDLIAAARRGERPVFASQSPLTRILADYIAHVAGVEFRVMTVQGGGEMMQTILGGHADFGFSGGPHVDHVAAGKMRVLAAAEDNRLASAPDVPTLIELGYDIASCALFVVSAPPVMPAPIVARLSHALAEAIAAPAMQTLLANLQYPPYYLDPDAVSAALQAETRTLEHAMARIGSTRSGALSAGFMPLAALTLVLGAGSALVFAGRGRPQPAARSPTGLGPAQWHYLGIAASILLSAWVALLLWGYLAGAGLLVAGFLRLARSPWRQALITAVALPLVLWLVFDRLLGFPLP